MIGKFRRFYIINKYAMINTLQTLKMLKQVKKEQLKKYVFLPTAIDL